MASKEEPTTIKKYANRRLYNTGTSTYVTLEDLAQMVKNGDEFVVHDAKSGDNITRSVLTQIIFDQEAKEGQNLLPIAFLRQLISFYGDSMQAMVPSYLEHSMNLFAREQDKIREQMTQAFGGMGMGAMEENVRRNMELFQKAMSMFMPFAAQESARPVQGEKAKTPGKDPERDADLDSLRAQIAEMQKKLDRLS